MLRFILALTALLALGTTVPASAEVVRVERADRSAPARVSYVDAVTDRRGRYLFTYVELRNGAAFEVTDCRRPVTRGMKMRAVRRICR